MMRLSANTQIDLIEDFNSTSRYLDGIVNIGNPFSNVKSNLSCRIAVK